jgi:hypothetical protein
MSQMGGGDKASPANGLSNRCCKLRAGEAMAIFHSKRKD